MQARLKVQPVSNLFVCWTRRVLGWADQTEERAVIEERGGKKEKRWGVGGGTWGERRREMERETGERGKEREEVREQRRQRDKSQQRNNDEASQLHTSRKLSIRKLENYYICLKI